MKRLLSFSIALLFMVVLLAPLFEAFSQSVAVKREAMSPGRRSSGPPNYTAPSGPNYVSTGLRVVPIGMRAYLSADTVGSGSTVVTSFSWSITSKPTGSNATLDSTNKRWTTFIPDVTGRYIIQVSVNTGGKTAYDTLFASTYQGNPTTGFSCSLCHYEKNDEWAKTPHATIYKRGISGQLEVNQYGRGAYAASCARCHTTGWESTTNNGNFGYLAKQAGWDTTWYKGLPFEAGDYWIPYGDTTLWATLRGNNPNIIPVATIGCETCHGPGKDHLGDKTKIAVSLEAGVCNQCHDAPRKHRLGSYWAASSHATMPLSGFTNYGTYEGRCYPCHSGSAFVAYTEAKYNPDYSKIKRLASIACATCHDPHSEKNPKQLRTVSVDSLANGYRVPAGRGGLGQLCMNCHHARENTVARVASQQVRFADRFYPHYSPQADMYLGANAYEYNLGITGLGTHHGVKDGCVTCHMAERVLGSSVHADHELNMKVDGKDFVEGCISCHGEIEEFDDIKAAVDYDGNGRIEGVQTEVKGLLARLKSLLPLDATGEPVNMAKDSMLVKNHPRYPAVLPPIFNYYFVKNDGSYGVHNVKYAVALLRASIGIVTGVELENLQVPEAFQLSQNYPNPFNPTTEIRIAVPRDSKVQVLIFDILGRKVKTLVDEALAAGTYRVKWDARDDNGQAVASGVYLYRIVANSSSARGQDFVLTKKMILMK